jgi:tetratricopeptide (TPR) repeat protein
MNLANIFLDLGRYEDSRNALKEALRQNPKHVSAYLNLGEIFRLERKHEQAKSCFLKAAELAPNSPQVLFNLGNIYYELNNLELAVDYYQDSIRRNPENAQAHQNLATVLISLGDLEPAEAHFRKAINLDQRLASAYYNLAHLKKNALSKSEIQGIRKLLNSPSLGTRKEIMLSFTLGKVYADVKEPKKAFGYYSKGNRARQKEAANLGRHFNPAAHSKIVDQLIRTFNTSFFEQTREPGSTSAKPVLIVGMPRSGTTLIEQILSSHPEVFGAGELEQLFHLQKKAGSPEAMTTLDQSSRAALAVQYLHYLERLAGDEARIVDKMPENFLFLGFFALLFPLARIVHCTRNPLDTCLSCYFHHFTEAHEYTNDLEHLGSFYQNYQRLMQHWKQVLPNPILDVSYEGLLESPEATSREMIEFLGLNWDAGVLQFYTNKRAVRTASNVQVRQPLYASSVNKWREYADALTPLREMLREADI